MPVVRGIHLTNEEYEEVKQYLHDEEFPLADVVAKMRKDKDAKASYYLSRSYLTSQKQGE